MQSTKRYKKNFWERIEYTDLAFMFLGLIVIDISLNFNWSHFLVIALGLGMAVVSFSVSEKGLLKSSKFKKLVNRTDFKIILSMIVMAVVMVFYTAEASAFWFANEQEAALTYIGELFSEGYTAGEAGTIAQQALSALVRLLFLGIRIAVLGGAGWKIIGGLTQGDEGEAKKKTIITGMTILAMSIVVDMAGNLILGSTAEG